MVNYHRQVSGYYVSKQVGKANVFLIVKTLWDFISTIITLLCNYNLMINLQL